MVDTCDGKNTLHATAMGTYQHKSANPTIVLPIAKESLIQLNGEPLPKVPSTVIPLVSTHIKGSPKPQPSPQYKDYKIGRGFVMIGKAETNEIAWLLARSLSRTTTMVTPIESVQTDAPQVERQSTTQNIPVWGAYSAVSRENLARPIDQAYAWPIINAPAHECDTLVTALSELRNVSLAADPHHKPIITLDMDLYKRALKMECLVDRYKDMWILAPGAFHISLCNLRCLGRTVDGSSGLEDIWVAAEVYSSVTVSQILNGKHYRGPLRPMR